MRIINKVILGVGAAAILAGPMLTPSARENPLGTTERVYQVRAQLDELEQYWGTFTENQAASYKSLSSEYAQLRSDPEYPRLEKAFLREEGERRREHTLYEALMMLPGVLVMCAGTKKALDDQRRENQEFIRRMEEEHQGRMREMKQEHEDWIKAHAEIMRAWREEEKEDDEFLKNLGLE